jgi:hypothetical protein
MTVFYRLSHKYVNFLSAWPHIAFQNHQEDAPLDYDNIHKIIYWYAGGL